MTYRYKSWEKFLRKLYRGLRPIPSSAWTHGIIDDICEVNLTPIGELVRFFEKCLIVLEDLRGKEIGDYLEFGVFNGASMTGAYLAVKNIKNAKMRLVGFDSYQGLPPETDEDGSFLQKGFYTCSFEEMKSCLRIRGVDPNRITWVNGWFKDTLNNQTVENYELTSPGIVFVDCDTYESSKAVLDFVAPLITKPAVFCFDDWKLYNMDLDETGEYKAFNEFLEENPHLKAKEIKSYNRKSRSFLVRSKK